ncbi:MAG TPA: ATP-binding protein [Bacteroidota bacterium]|nr:ATP-binding protein [Bacteroidota bacterium]
MAASLENEGGIAYVYGESIPSNNTKSGLLHPARLTSSISIPSIPSNIKLVERFLLDISDSFAIEEAVLDRIMISITEIVNNGILHGNRSNPEKFVTVTCSCFDDRIEFVIADEGAGFSPDNIPDPLADNNLLKEGGRGVLIVRSMMDNVTFSKTAKGMEVHLRILLAKE